MAATLRLTCVASTRKFLLNYSSLKAVRSIGATQWRCILPLIDILDQKPLVSLAAVQRVQNRYYSRADGEYEKLWAAATGGRGTGRRKKKKVQKGVDPEKLKYGRGESKWEGFNAPIILEGDAVRKDEETNQWVESERTKRTSWFSRGWSGRTWPGRKVGHPEKPDKELMKDFDSVVLELVRVSNVTAKGKKRSHRALVVVGNRRGAAGFGVGKGQTSMSAIRKARNKAANYLYYVERCDDHTIFHNLETKYKKTRVIFERKPSGYGLRCHRAIKEIADLLGIQDMRCKVIGPTTPLSLVRAVFQGLISQESHQELANRTGLNVVEFRKELGNRPIVVATPSAENAKKSLKKRAEKDDYDFHEIFDPHKGLHRPKRKSDLL